MKWHTEKHKTSSLVPYEHNPRTLSDKQRQDLEKSLHKPAAEQQVTAGGV